MGTLSDSPEDKLISGAVKGTLEYSEDKIKSLVKRFLNRDLVFVEDLETIQVARDQRKTPEWEIFTKYVDHHGLRVVFLMGLTLRYREKNKQPLDSLKRQILKKFGREGLHVAYFVQNGCFSKLFGNILEKESTTEKLKMEIRKLFLDIEKYTVFVNYRDSVDRKVKEVITKIDAHNPRTFIISGIGTAAKKCRKIQRLVMKEIDGYTVESYKTENKEMFFLNMIEDSTLVL